MHFILTSVYGIDSLDNGIDNVFAILVAPDTVRRDKEIVLFNVAPFLEVVLFAGLDHTFFKTS